MFTDSAGGVLDSPSGLFARDEWQFVAARYDRTSASLTVAGASVDGTEGAGNNVGHGSLFVGANPFFTEDFDGRIDNVFIHDRLLGDA